MIHNLALVKIHNLGSKWISLFTTGLPHACSGWLRQWVEQYLDVGTYMIVKPVERTRDLYWICDMSCGSAFELGASGLPYYCTSICVRSWCNWCASSVDSKKKSCIHPSRHDFPISPPACPSSGWTANPIRAASGTQILLKGHHQSITSTKGLQKNRVQKCQMTGSATQMGLYSNLAPSLVQASDNQSSVSTSPLSFGNLMSHMIGWRTAALEV